jgi:hypothetical protein
MKKLTLLVVAIAIVALVAGCFGAAKRVPYTNAEISPKLAEFDKNPAMNFALMAKADYPATEIPAVDTFLKKANVIKATVLVAKEMIKKAKAEIAGAGDFSKAVEELKAKKGSMPAEKVTQMKMIVENLKLVGELLMGLKDQVMGIVDEGKKLLTTVPAELAKNPKDAMKLGSVKDAMSQTIDSITSLKDELVPLAKEIAGITDVVAGLF